MCVFNEQEIEVLLKYLLTKSDVRIRSFDRLNLAHTSVIAHPLDRRDTSQAAELEGSPHQALQNRNSVQDSCVFR